MLDRRKAASASIRSVTSDPETNDRYHTRGALDGLVYGVDVQVDGGTMTSL